jgi:hypothetical protein
MPLDIKNGLKQLGRHPYSYYTHVNKAPKIANKNTIKPKLTF